jgi:hypothetical protein
MMNPTAMGPASAGLAPPAASPSALGPFSGDPASAPPAPEHPLRPVIGQWVEKIKKAQEFKKARFGDQADDCMSFFNGPYDFLYQKKYAASSGGFSLNTGSDDDDMPAPTFQMTVNKVAEGVQLFGPALYYKNPVRQVNPRVVPDLPPQIWGDPNSFQGQVMAAQQQAQVDALRLMDRVRAVLLEFYLNYTPTELALKENSRRAIDEGIIKGMGLLWTETYQPQGAQFRLVGSFYDTVDNLVLDPDAESIDDCKWVAKRCVHPVWEVEDEYGLPRDSLKGNYESVNRQSEVNADPDGDYFRKQGTCNDLVVYWKIWSKMGAGGRLTGVGDDMKAVLEQFGNYCYLVVAEGTPYPLNVPPDLINAAGADQQIMQRMDWPTPYWLDDRWPFTPLVFHEVPRSAWPMSHFKPALGELKFLNWAYSFIASKIRVTCRDFIAIRKSVGQEIKDAILHGKDLTLLEIESAHGTLSEIVSFLNHPQFNGDIWKVIEAVTENFEKRTGLTELMYGESARQMRSAAEADAKQAGAQIRPDDMAQRVEDWMTEVARKEALAVRWHLGSADVQMIMGPPAAQAWDRFVVSANPYEIVRQLDYRIEAGSTKKPNRDRDAQNAQQAMQTLFQPLFAYAQATGNVGPVNALIGFWAKTIDLDASGFLLAPPPPPPAPAGPDGPQQGPPQPGGGGGPPPAQAA